MAVSGVPRHLRFVYPFLNADNDREGRTVCVAVDFTPSAHRVHKEVCVCVCVCVLVSVRIIPKKSSVSHLNNNQTFLKSSFLAAG